MEPPRQADGDPDYAKRLEQLYRRIVTDDAGRSADPKQDEWSDWETPSSLNGWIKQDTLADWLKANGKQSGFQDDTQYPGYEGDFDFMQVILHRGDPFERTVSEWLATQVPGGLTIIGARGNGVRSLALAQRTAKAMFDQAAVIVGGVLRNPQDRTYGSPDLLVRSDLLATIFPNPPLAPAPFAAPNLGGFGYVVVDVKFFARPAHLPDQAPLRLLDTVHNNIYNRAAGRLCGAASPVSYLLGRGPLVACLYPLDLERLGEDLRTTEEEARAWMTRLRREGSGWTPLPEPTVPQLRPNMKADWDIGWTRARREIADHLADITLLPFCEMAHRDRAFANGIERWDDPRLTGEILGLQHQRAKVIDRILSANRPGNTAPILPATVTVDDEWRTPAGLEVFCAVQTLDDLAVAFPGAPPSNRRRAVAIAYTAQAHGGATVRASLSASEVSEAGQSELIRSVRDAIAKLARSQGVDEADVRLYQWSTRIPTEAGFARMDLRQELFSRVPLAVRGALGHRLHEVAAALRQQGLITAAFPDHPSNGKEAAAAIWHAAQNAAANGTRLSDSPLMTAVCAYNQARGDAMAQILQYLRANVFIAQVPLPEAA